MPTGVETIEILGKPAVDRFGDPTGPAPDPVPVRGCLTWPRTSREEGRGWVAIDGLNVFVPAGRPLPSHEDQVRARGEVWDMDGEVADYQAKGAILTLKRRGT